MITLKNKNTMTKFEKIIYILMVILSLSAAVIGFIGEKEFTWPLLTFVWVLHAYNNYQRGLDEGKKLG